MKVVSLSVKNLRCLKNIVNMPLHGLTILIGENDAGKSTVLDAIDMALNKRPPVPDDYYVCNGGTPEQEIVIELLLDCSQDSKRPDQKYLARDGLLHYRVIHTPGAVRTEVLGKRFVNPALNQDYTRLGAGPFDELLESLGIRPEGRLNNDVRLRLIQDYLTSANPETTYDWIEIRNELNEFLPRFERFSTSEYRNPEALIQRTLTSVVEAYLYETDEATDTKSLIKPLQEVRDELKARLDARISELLAFVQVYNPGVTSLWIEPVVDFAKGFQTGRLFLGGQYGIYHMGNKGEGTKKRLFMSILDWDRKVMLETDNRPVIRGYDEPDANLHYDAQRKMFYSLRDLTAGERTKIQAVVCTHSLSMIDRAPAQNINLLRLDQEGKCQVSYLSTNGDEEIAEFLGDMSRSMGVPNSALFYERCFILVEGPTEENSLPTIYRNLHESSLIEDGIRIINIGGCGGWASFVKMMGINKKDLMLFLLDNDCNQPESSCELNEQSLLELGFDTDFMKTNVFYIGSKEYEDAFSSEIYAAVLNRCWPKASGDLWKPSDVDALRSDLKFSDRIVIEANRHSRMGRNKGCTKPKLGLEVARHCKNAVDVPEPIRQVFAKARVIANPVQGASRQNSLFAVTCDTVHA